jgi:amidohydrolase
MDVSKIAESYNDYLIEMRRYFHAHPEVSEKEYETSKVIKAELDKYGIEWRPCGMETGILATIKGAKPGKTVLLRADMDALTIQEETGVDYVSQNEGIMHACGHDCHISTLLTAARVLNDHKDELCGTVKLAFQPAEEVATGAAAMIAEGALDGVDGCFAIHVWSDVDAGTVSIEHGPRMAAADRFVIDVHGRGGHGSAPHQCVDAVVVTAAICHNLQEVVSREFCPADAAVLTLGRMESGSRWNIIAEYGSLEGTTRYYKTEYTEKFKEAIERVATQTAAAYRAEATVNYIHLIPPTVNEDSFTDMAIEAAKKAIGEDCLFHLPAVTGGEDFSRFLEQKPGAIAFMGVRNEAKGACWAQHHCKYNVDEDALINSVKMYVQVAMDFNAGK